MRRPSGIRPFAAPALALALALSLAAARPAAASAELALHGWPGRGTDAERLFAPALKAPRDSAALAGALALAERTLQSDGWLDARASGAWNAGAPDSLGVAVVPGVRYRWGRLVIEAPPADSALLAQGLRWRAGEWADPAALGEAVDAAIGHAVAAGHAWARLSLTSFEPDSGRVDVRLVGAAGPSVIVGDVRFEGLQTTRRDVAMRALGRLVGRPYDPAAARAGGERLSQLGVFTRVEPLGLSGASDWGHGVLGYRVEEPHYNQFEGAVGVQGSGGAVGLANLQLGNLLGTARSVTLGWQSRGRGLSDFRVRYAEPFVGGLPFRLEAALAQQIQDTLYTRTQWGGRLAHALGSGDRIEAGIDEERVVQTRGDVREADLQSTVFAIERDARDDAVAPRRGARLAVTGTEIFKRETLSDAVVALAGPGAATSRRSRESAVDVRAEWHRPLTEATGLSLETWASGRISSQRVLPDYERLLVGGATTLRGHDEEAFHVDRVALTRLEWRRFLGANGERAELFWDHAEMQTRVAVTDSTGATIGDRPRHDRADGIGAGLRLRAAGGFVDVDYGLEPGRGFLDGKIHLRLVTTF